MSILLVDPLATSPKVTRSIGVKISKVSPE